MKTEESFDIPSQPKAVIRSLSQGKNVKSNSVKMYCTRKFIFDHGAYMYINVPKKCD